MRYACTIYHGMEYGLVLLYQVAEPKQQLHYPLICIRFLSSHHRVDIDKQYEKYENMDISKTYKVNARAIVIKESGRNLGVCKSTSELY